MSQSRIHGLRAGRDDGLGTDGSLTHKTDADVRTFLVKQLPDGACAAHRQIPCCCLAHMTESTGPYNRLHAAKSSRSGDGGTRWRRQSYPGGICHPRSSGPDRRSASRVYSRSWVTAASSVLAPPEAVRCSGWPRAVRPSGLSPHVVPSSMRAAVGWSSFRPDGTFRGPTQSCLPATRQLPLTCGAPPGARRGRHVSAVPCLRRPGLPGRQPPGMRPQA